MIVVDSYLVWRACTNHHGTTFNEYIHGLADELIEYELTTRQQRSASAFGAFQSPNPNNKRGPPILHLTPQKKLRPQPCTPAGNTNKGQARCQGWCKVCKDFKTTHISSQCQRPVPLCHPKTERDCWSEHCTLAHPGEPYVD